MSISSRAVARLALIAVLVALPAAAPAASPPRDQAGRIIPRLAPATIGRLVRRMDASPALHRLLALCPADAYRKLGSGTAAGVTQAACGRGAERCLALCLERAGADACFTLAGIVQAAPRLDPLYAESLYQMACAAGDAAGCVNRAAGLRNTSYAGDPFPKRPAAGRLACQLKSFSLGCAANDPWGCTMRGQAELLGEGQPADAAAARRDFAKACAADPQFAACTYAKKLMEGMGKPPAGLGGVKTIPISDE